MIHPKEIERARRLRETDVRARMLVDSVVSQAMHDHRGREIDRPERFAHDVALTATALLIERIYNEDAELCAIRAERDAYRERAIEGLKFYHPPLTFPVTIKPGDQS